MFHGTDFYETILESKPGKKGFLGPGIYFTSDVRTAKMYATGNGYTTAYIYEARITVNNPFVVKTSNPVEEILGKAIIAKRKETNSFPVTWGQNSDIKKLKEKEYDCIIWKYAGVKEIFVFYPEIIEIVSVTKIEEE